MDGCFMMYGTQCMDGRLIMKGWMSYHVKADGATMEFPELTIIDIEAYTSTSMNFNRTEE